MNARECLQIFNLDSSANDEDLKLAYRKAVKYWHPDRYQQATAETRSTAEQQMLSVNTAYQVLSRYYQEHGHMPGYFNPPDNLTPFSSGKADTPYQKKNSTTSTTGTTSTTSKSDSSASGGIGRQANRQSQRGVVWFIIAFAAIFIIYFLSDLSTPPTEQTSLAESNTEAQNTVTDSDSSQKPQKTSPVENEGTADEEIASPFVTKKRKYAFERNSNLGIYDEPEDEKYFTYGDTAGRVFEVQGVPTKTVGDIWYYGASEVHFHDGRVVSWYNANGNKLKAKTEKSKQ
jgi:hypothetical protein